MVSQSSTTGSLLNRTYDQKVVRQSIVKWLIKRNLLFLMIDDSHFEQMIQPMQHTFKIILIFFFFRKHFKAIALGGFLENFLNAGCIDCIICSK